MRKSKEEAARTRERIIEAAATEFRRNGIGATGLSELMATAGLTHGGFYRHFRSKDQLVTEACASTLDSLAEWLAVPVSAQNKSNALEAVASSYLSVEHRDNPAGGCPLSALGSELARSDDKTRAVATQGLLKIVDFIARQHGDIRPNIAKRRALVAVSTMVGAMTLARMVNDSKLSSALLREAARHVGAGQAAATDHRS